MIQPLVMLVSLAAIVAGVFSAGWGWGILAVPIVLLLLGLFGIRQNRWKHIPELSDDANQMLQKFGLNYTMPSAGRDFSASASALMFAGIALGIISVIKGFWWGLGIGGVNWFLMLYISRAFNPTNFLKTPFEIMAHEEVIAWLANRQ